MTEKTPAEIEMLEMIEKEVKMFILNERLKEFEKGIKQIEELMMRKNER